MKLKLSLVVLILILFSCVTPYQPSGLAGGYTNRKIGKNKWMVTFDGNGYTNRSTVEEYAFRRAEEVCRENGFDNYELLKQNDSTDSFKTPDNYNCTQSYGNVNCQNLGGNSVNRHSISLVFTCYSDRNSSLSH